jgi:hypothetical protein
VLIRTSIFAGVAHHSTIIALSLNLCDIEPHYLHGLLHSLPPLQLLSLKEVYLDNLAVMVLWGENKPDSDEGHLENWGKLGSSI